MPPDVPGQQSGGTLPSATHELCREQAAAQSAEAVHPASEAARAAPHSPAAGLDTERGPTTGHAAALGVGVAGPAQQHALGAGVASHPQGIVSFQLPFRGSGLVNRSPGPPLGVAASEYKDADAFMELAFYGVSTHVE